MTKKRILLVAPFTLLPGEEGYNRFRYIAELLSKEHEVTFVTSSFNHPKKEQRKQASEFGNLPYELVLLHEPGYTANISLKRIRSHGQFVKNLEGFLAMKTGLYDFVYAAFPMIQSAKVAGQFAKDNGIPFYLDIQDVWPESLVVYTKYGRGILKALLKPLSNKADHVYRMADAIVAVSNTYAERAQKVNNHAQHILPLNIGIDVADFDAQAARSNFTIEKEPHEIIGVYSGSMSHSYDVATVIKASALLRNKDIAFKLLVVGQGPDEAHLKKLATDIQAPVKFLGYRSFGEMASVLKQADIGFHAISASSQSTMTNKFGDYCAAGLTIFNSSPSVEIQTIVTDHELGRNYKAADAKQLAEEIASFIENSEGIDRTKKNSRSFAEGALDRPKTYQKLLELFR